MKKIILSLFLCFCGFAVAAQEVHPSSEEAVDDGFLALEAGLGYNTYETSQFLKAPLSFSGGSGQREISTRLLLLSDLAHASDYFSANSSFVKPNGIYLFNYGLIDIDYLSWYGKKWSAGFGAGLAHQGFLISGADRSAHAITIRLRAQGFIYWWDYLATQAVITLPVAVYQSATDEFRLLHAELNTLFDFKGRVRNPEPQSFMFSASLHYDFTHLNHAVRSYSQHEFTPMLKVIVLY